MRWRLEWLYSSSVSVSSQSCLLAKRFIALLESPPHFHSLYYYLKFVLWGPPLFWLWILCSQLHFLLHSFRNYNVTSIEVKEKIKKQNLKIHRKNRRRSRFVFFWFSCLILISQNKIQLWSLGRRNCQLESLKQLNILLLVNLFGAKTALRSVVFTCQLTWIPPFCAGTFFFWPWRVLLKTFSAAPNQWFLFVTR